MKSNTFFVIALLILILIGGYFLFFNAKSINGNFISASGEVQIVELLVENGKYVLNPVTVKKGTPVRIEADISKMPGCSKSIRIPAFNIQKNLNVNDNMIEFTPTKAGTFNIMCSMNMYKGTITILENDGSKSNYVEKASSSGGSCSANGGSCGCGDRR